jgi:hypothetical protein
LLYFVYHYCADFDTAKIIYSPAKAGGNSTQFNYIVLGIDIAFELPLALASGEIGNYLIKD